MSDRIQSTSIAETHRHKYSLPPEGSAGYRKNAFRGTRPEVFCKKMFLEISQNSQKNTCARDSLFYRPRPATLLKKSLWHRCFPVNFTKFLRIPISTEHLWWLFLSFTSQRCFIDISEWKRTWLISICKLNKFTVARKKKGLYMGGERIRVLANIWREIANQEKLH